MTAVFTQTISRSVDNFSRWTATFIPIVLFGSTVFFGQTVSAQTDSTSTNNKLLVGIRVAPFFPTILTIKDEKYDPNGLFYMPYSHVPRGIHYSFSIYWQYSKHFLETGITFRPHTYYRNFKDPLYIHNAGYISDLSEYTFGSFCFQYSYQLFEKKKMSYKISLGYSYYNIVTRDRPGVSNPTITIFSNNYFVSFRPQIKINNVLFLDIEPIISYQKNYFPKNVVVVNSFDTDKIYLQLKTGLNLLLQ